MNIIGGMARAFITIFIAVFVIGWGIGLYMGTKI